MFEPETATVAVSFPAAPSIVRSPLREVKVIPAVKATRVSNDSTRKVRFRCSRRRRSARRDGLERFTREFPRLEVLEDEQ